MDKYGVATFDLFEIQALIKKPGTRIITKRSRIEAVKLGYASDTDMAHRIQLLRPDEIYKTMEAVKCPGLWQDVYRTFDGVVPLYIKIQKSFDGKGVIIQFKKK